MSEHLDGFEPDDITVDDEDFEADDFYPFATTQQWAALSTDIREGELAVLTFVMCHLNTLTGKFDAGFGRKRVAQRFGRSLDWVDKRFNDLIRVGALTKQHMYWKFDPETGKNVRTPEQFDPETGNKRGAAPNRWRVRMTPPGGQKFEGALNIGEFYYPEKIEKRLRKHGVTTPPKKASDQGGSRKTAGQGVAAAQRPGVAAPARPGVAAAQRPKLSSKRTTAVRTTKRSPSVGSLTSADAVIEPQSTDGRTDGNFSAESTTAPAAPTSVAGALVEAKSIQADLERIDLRPTQRRALVDAVDAALLRFSEDQVSKYLRAKAREARTATWLLGAFTDWVDSIATLPKPGHGNDAMVLAAVEAAVATGKAMTEPAAFAPSPEVIAAATPVAPTEPAAEPARPRIVFARPESKKPVHSVEATPFEALDGKFVPSRIRKAAQCPTEQQDSDSVTATLAG